MPLFKKDTEVLFVHIPKCGGSSIIESFRSQQWQVELLNEPAKNNVPDILPCNPQHYHYELLYHFLNINEIKEKFVIVRNPFHRLISEMVWRLPQWNNKIDQNGYDLIFYNGLENFFISRGNDFLINENHFKNNKDEYLNRKQRLYYDNHLRPQIDFLNEDFKLFKLEEIDKIKKYLERFNIDKIFDINKTTSKEKPNFYNGFSTTFKNLYKKLYGEDHKQLGYEMPFGD